MENLKGMIPLKSEQLPTYDGLILPGFPPLLADPSKHMAAIRNLDSRDSDILICAYAKSGTHWVSEIIEQLISGKAEYSTKTKGGAFLEAADFDDIGLKDMSSPRNLNTHLPFRLLPAKHTELNAKIIRIMRNPKDVAVSLYHHMKKDPFVGGDKSMPWEVFIQMYTQKGPYGTWFEYEKDWEQVMKDNPKLNVLTLYYETLKLNTEQEIKKIADFLGINYTNDFLKQVTEKVDFKNVQKGKTDRSSNFSVDGKPIIYRKGQIGDWKNWFTVAQNEAFNSIYEKEMENSNLKSKFSVYM